MRGRLGQATSSGRREDEVRLGLYGGWGLMGVLLVLVLALGTVMSVVWLRRHRLQLALESMGWAIPEWGERSLKKILRRVRQSEIYSDIYDRNISRFLKDACRVGSPAQEWLIRWLSQYHSYSTSLFRHPWQFQFLEEVLPGLMEERRQQGQAPFLLLSLGSSTGKEAVSLVISFLEAARGLANPKPEEWDFNQYSSWGKVLGIEIREDLVQRAYQEQSGPVTGIPSLSRVQVGDLPSYIINSVEKNDGLSHPENLTEVTEGQRQSLCRAIQQLVEAYQPHFGRMLAFEVMSLLDPRTFAAIGKADVIFLRNVMDQMPKRSARKLAYELGTRMRPGAYLFTTETPEELVWWAKMDLSRFEIVERREDGIVLHKRAASPGPSLDVLSGSFLDMMGLLLSLLALPALAFLAILGGPGSGVEPFDFTQGSILSVSRRIEGRGMMEIQSGSEFYIPPRKRWEWRAWEILFLKMVWEFRLIPLFNSYITEPWIDLGRKPIEYQSRWVRGAAAIESDASDSFNFLTDFLNWLKGLLEWLLSVYYLYWRLLLKLLGVWQRMSVSLRGVTTVLIRFANVKRISGGDEAIFFIDNKIASLPSVPARQSVPKEAGGARRYDTKINSHQLGAVVIASAQPIVSEDYPEDDLSEERRFIAAGDAVGAVVVGSVRPLTEEGMAAYQRK